MEEPKISFNVRDGIHTCTIYPPSGEVQFAVMDSTDDDASPQPLLFFRYALKDLDILSRLMAMMAKRDRQPVLYIWDTAEDKSIMLSVFIVDNPGSEGIKRVIGPEGTTHVKPWMQWGSIAMVARTVIPRDIAADFLNHFKRHKSARIVVLENAESIPDRFIVEEFNPVHTFVTEHVYEEKIGDD